MTSTPIDAPPPAAEASRPLASLVPRSGWTAPDLREVWEARDLLWSFAVRDIKVRYKQTALGVVWVVFQPLAAAVIFSFVFGKVARIDTPGGVPYLPFAFCGLIAWGLLNSTTARSSASMVGNAHLLSKVYFPRLVLPASTVLSALLDFAVAATVLAVMLCVYRLGPAEPRLTLPGPGLLLAPLVLGALIVMGLGIGLLASALSVTYRDVGHVLPVALHLVFYASPAVYPVAQVPEEYRFWYLLNPVAPLLEAFRWSVLGPSVGTLYAGPLAWSFAVALGVLIVGTLAFKRMERTFADVV